MPSAGWFASWDAPTSCVSATKPAPTGYGLYWQLLGLGVHCDVIAPSLVPVKPGDRVKTDRRDALKLAQCYRAGDLTPVWVPDAEQEALRDLVRAREAAKKDQLRARHRLGKFLLRQGRRRPAHLKMAWTARHLDWIRALRFFSPLQTHSLLTRLGCETPARGEYRRRMSTRPTVRGSHSRIKSSVRIDDQRHPRARLRRPRLD